MEDPCSEKDRSGVIATILERIPRLDEDAIVLRELCPLAKDQPSCVGCTGTLLTLLQMFDAVTTISDNGGKEVRVKARSEAGTYFFRSLAAYVRKHMILVSNWERQRVGEDLPATQTLVSGTQFVYLMEHKRAVEYKDLSPIREEFVSHVVIKARIRGKREPVYLVQYDEQARQFQLIGGKKRSEDTNALNVMIREIDEELPLNHLQFDRDYKLQKLVSNLQHIQLSPTYGAYTKYHFNVYQATVKRRQLLLRPIDRWVTLKELLHSENNGRARRPSEYLSKLDRQLAGGLESLPLSIDEVQKRPLREIIRNRKWEVAGIAIGIVGIILAVLFFLLQH